MCSAPLCPFDCRSVLRLQPRLHDIHDVVLQPQSSERRHAMRRDDRAAPDLRAGVRRHGARCHLLGQRPNAWRGQVAAHPGCHHCALVFVCLVPLHACAALSRAASQLPGAVHAAVGECAACSSCKHAGRPRDGRRDACCGQQHCGVSPMTTVQRVPFSASTRRLCPAVDARVPAAS